MDFHESKDTDRALFEWRAQIYVVEPSRAALSLLFLHLLVRCLL